MLKCKEIRDKKIHTSMYPGSPSPNEGYVQPPFLIQRFFHYVNVVQYKPPRLSRTPSRKHTTSLFTQHSPNPMMDSESRWFKGPFTKPPNTMEKLEEEAFTMALGLFNSETIECSPFQESLLSIISPRLLIFSYIKI